MRDTRVDFLARFTVVCVAASMPFRWIHDSESMRTRRPSYGRIGYVTGLRQTVPGIRHHSAVVSFGPVAPGDTLQSLGLKGGISLAGSAHVRSRFFGRIALL